MIIVLSCIAYFKNILPSAAYWVFSPFMSHLRDDLYLLYFGRLRCCMVITASMRLNECPQLLFQRVLLQYFTKTCYQKDICLGNHCFYNLPCIGKEEKCVKTLPDHVLSCILLLVS